MRRCVFLCEIDNLFILKCEIYNYFYFLCEIDRNMEASSWIEAYLQPIFHQCVVCAFLFIYFFVKIIFVCNNSGEANKIVKIEDNVFPFSPDNLNTSSPEFLEALAMKSHLVIRMLENRIGEKHAFKK